MPNRQKTSKHISLITGIYYYLALSVLSITLVLITYWQVERDTTIVNQTNIEVVSTENSRLFYVPISFCNRSITEFQVERYYFNTKELVYYTVPSTTYLAPQEDREDACFDTVLNAFTGSLEPGEYEYRIFISYSINPIQTKRSLAALVNVTVE